MGRDSLESDSPIFDVIEQAYIHGIPVGGTYIRANAIHVAAAVSLGLITTQLPDKSFGSMYRPTYRGTFILFHEER